MITSEFFEGDLSLSYIKSAENPSIKLFRKIMSSKKERMNYKIFPLEGVRLVFDALENDAPVRKIFITETAYYKHWEKLESFELSKIDVAVISDELGKKISDTANTQGIFAQCGFSDNNSVSGNLKSFGKYAVLHKLQDPGNVGMIIRTADALGLDGVIFCESCDIYNPKVVRATMGSLFRIPVFRDVNLDELFIELADKKIKSFAAVVQADAKDVKKTDFSTGGAVFIGNEGNGLDEAVTSFCSEQITIKMTGNAESLNAAMAAGIIMWELMRGE